MDTDVNIVSGRSALLELSSRNDIDLVMNGLVGASGMEPTIRALEAKIDQLVYDLYGLTDEEIAIVEESVG